ncbi:MAG TPA: hypothetical protein VGW38_25585 [Chloroflexota bacterium]|nr:hypothetical protein [Chloroflexota bacterium]
MRQIEAGALDELALRPDAFKEHDQLELEEHHWIDRGTPTRGVAFADHVTDEAQVEFRLQVAVEVIVGNQAI